MIIKSKSDLAKHSELLYTTYHEAGHAIYGLLHGIRVPSVYVFENKKNKRVEGCCMYEFEAQLSEIEDPIYLYKRLYYTICAYYAGLVAEKHYFKNISGSDKFPLFLRDGSSDDTLFAANLIKQYNLAPSGPKRYSYKKQLIKETLIELQEHWDAVTLVSHSLFKKKKLSYYDLKALLTRKSKNKDFWKLQFKIIDNIFNNLDSLTKIS